MARTLCHKSTPSLSSFLPSEFPRLPGRLSSDRRVEDRRATAAVLTLLLLLYRGTTQISCPLLCLPSSLLSTKRSGVLPSVPVQGSALQYTPACPLLHLLYNYLISTSFPPIPSYPFVNPICSTIHPPVRPSTYPSVHPSRRR